MKEQQDKTDLPSGSGFSNSNPKIYENQDNIESIENDFYILKSAHHNEMGEAMRLWESLRFM
jgi:hypothetical protein